MTSPPYPSSAGPTERRFVERLAARESTNRVMLASGDESWPGDLLNFAAAGVSILCQHPVEPGAELCLRLGPLGTARAARAIHCSPLPSGSYLVGVKLEQPLTFVELQALVRPDAAS